MEQWFKSSKRSRSVMLPAITFVVSSVMPTRDGSTGSLLEQLLARRGSDAEQAATHVRYFEK